MVAVTLAFKEIVNVSCPLIIFALSFSVVPIVKVVSLTAVCGRRMVIPVRVNAPARDLQSSISHGRTSGCNQHI